MDRPSSSLPQHESALEKVAVSRRSSKASLPLYHAKTPPNAAMASTELPSPINAVRACFGPTEVLKRMPRVLRIGHTLSREGIGNISRVPSLFEAHPGARTAVHGGSHQLKMAVLDRRIAPRSPKSVPRHSCPHRPSAWHPRLIEQPPAVAAPGTPARAGRAPAASLAEAPPPAGAWADHTADTQDRPPRTPASAGCSRASSATFGSQALLG